MVAWTSVGEPVRASAADRPTLVHLPGVAFSNSVAEWQIPVLKATFVARRGPRWNGISTLSSPLPSGSEPTFSPAVRPSQAWAADSANVSQSRSIRLSSARWYHRDGGP